MTGSQQTKNFEEEKDLDALCHLERKTSLRCTFYCAIQNKMEFSHWMSSTLFFLCWELQLAKASDYCGKFENKDYYCEEGYCCGNKDCCMAKYHYYEMWWFWLLWALVAAMACCCIYHRHQLQRGSGHHFHFARFFQPVLSVDTGSKNHKLPSYTEVLKMPKFDPPLDMSDAPPPYFESREELESSSTTSEVNCNMEESNTSTTETYPSTGPCKLVFLDENQTSKLPEHEI